MYYREVEADVLQEADRPGRRGRCRGGVARRLGRWRLRVELNNDWAMKGWEAWRWPRHRLSMAWVSGGGHDDQRTLRTGQAGGREVGVRSDLFAGTYQLESTVFFSHNKITSAGLSTGFNTSRTGPS